MSVRKVRDAVVLVGAFFALIWILQMFNWADGYRLDASFGILPRNIGHLGNIFTAPFLHFSWQHIEGNSIPLLVLGVLAAYRGIAKFLLVTLIVAFVSGLAVWLFQSGNELTVGASGLIFGYFGYVLVRGIVDRNLLDIGVGVVAGLLYWTILQVAIPGTPGISWIGHLGGLFGGVIAAWVLRARTPGQVTGRRWSTGLPAIRSGNRDNGGRNDGGRNDGGRDGGPERPAGHPDSGSADAGAGSGGAGGAGADSSGAGGSKAAADLLRELDDMGL